MSLNKDRKTIGALFDSIAGAYDKFNHITSMGIDIYWRHKAVKQMTPADKLLDVAIGTGDFALTALRKGKVQRAIGIDLSTEMMAIGKQKAEKEHLADRLQFVHGSALEMPFADGEFEAITCGYGIRNFSDLDAGLREMHRVLKDNGQLLILEFSYPRNPIVRLGYNLYFTHIMPLIGRFVSNNAGAFKYFRESVKSFIWGDEMIEHLKAAGFSQATYQTLTFGISTLYIAHK